MPTDFLKKVVVALMQTGAINFWITTLEESENFVNYVVEMVEEDPDPFINLIRFSLSCEQCKKRGIPEKCTHKIYEPAPWNAPAAMRKIQMLINDSNVFLRETIGLSGHSNSDRCFDNRCVRKLFESRKVGFENEDPEFIFTCVDPAAGGDGSRFAVISICRYGESKTCVCLRFFFFLLIPFLNSSKKFFVCHPEKKEVVPRFIYFFVILVECFDVPDED